MHIEKLIFLNDGRVVAFDKNDNQISKIQKKGWLQNYLEFLKDKKVGITRIKEITMPDGKKARIRKGYKKNQYFLGFISLNSLGKENERNKKA